MGGKGQHFELEHGGTELKRTQISPRCSRKYTLKNTRKTQFFTLTTSHAIHADITGCNSTPRSTYVRTVMLNMEARLMTQNRAINANNATAHAHRCPTRGPENQNVIS